MGATIAQPQSTVWRFLRDQTGLKATDRPTGMHEAQGPTLAVARAGRPMPLFSLPLSRNTHTLFRTKKYAREANGSAKTDGIEISSAFGPSEPPVSDLLGKIRPGPPNSPNGAQRPPQLLYAPFTGASSEASMHEPIPGNFPNDFGKI